MDAKQLADYVSEDQKAEFVESHLKDLTIVEPNFGDFMAWQAAASNSIKDTSLVESVYWLAVNACVRSAKGTKEFLTEADWRDGRANLHRAVGDAANAFLIEYTTGVRRKKPTKRQR